MRLSGYNFNVLWSVSSLTNIKAFLRLLLLESLGVVLKRTGMFVVLVVVGLRSFSLDLSGQLDILWHDGDSPGVDGTQVGVFKDTHEMGLCCFLKTHYGC